MHHPISSSATAQNIVDEMWYRNYTEWGWNIITGTDPKTGNPIKEWQTGGEYWNGNNLCGSDEINAWLINKMNNGLHTFIYGGHGGPNALGANEGAGRLIFRADDISNNQILHNAGKYPFIIAAACATGEFDKTTTDQLTNTIDCIAEEAVYLPNAGAIGYLGASRDSDSFANGDVDLKVLQAMYTNNSHIMGEAVMESKLNQYTRYQRQYNLFGDPAVNLFPTGGILSETTTLSGNQEFVTTLIVPPNVTLNITEGSNITFKNGASLVVNGTLNVNGTSSNMVTFDFVSPNPTTQNRIEFNYGPSGHISWANIKNAYAAVRGDGACPNIDNCNITDNTFGLYLTGTGTNSAQITNNHILRNSSYGIYLSNSSPTINDNQVFGPSSYGIYCLQYSSPTMNNNTITGSGNGLTCSYSSSPNLAGYYIEGHNVITNNNVGVSCDHYSIPFIGGPYGGLNSIYGNTQYNIKAYYGCNTIYAQNTWWGRYPLTSTEINKIYQYQSAIDYSNPYQTAPDPGRVLSKTSLAGGSATGNTTSGTDDELMNALYLQMQGKYDEAIASYRKIISKEMKTPKGTLALIKLNECYEKSGKSGFIEYLNSSIYPNISKNDELTILSKELETHWLIKDKKYNEAIESINKCKSDYKDKKDTYKYTLFNEGYTYLVYLKDLAKAKGAFTELESKYPEDQLVLDSKILLGENLQKYFSSKSIFNNVSENSQESGSIPSSYTLLGNYPNPFNPSTTISYGLPKQSNIEVKIYNIMGNEVRTFALNSQSAGYHNLQWDGNNSNNERVTSGIYIYRLRAISYEDGKVFEKSAKMMLLK